jgi:hypothetical protein
MRTGWAGGASLNMSTLRGTTRQLSGNLVLDVSPTLQQGVTGSITLAARITPALRLDVTPSLLITETHRQYRQYVATVPGGGAESRGGDPRRPTQPLHSTLPEIFNQSALHTLAIKLSYWFG